MRMGQTKRLTYAEKAFGEYVNCSWHRGSKPWTQSLLLINVLFTSCKLYFFWKSLSWHPPQSKPANQQMKARD